MQHSVDGSEGTGVRKSMNQDIMVRPCGDQALMVMFEQRISEEIHQQVIRLDIMLQNDPAVSETVPA